MRMTTDEALDLFLNAPLQDLCKKANDFKEKLHGKKVFWVNNRQINYTNVCVLHCRFCAFSKIKKDNPEAYDWDLPTIHQKAKEAIEKLCAAEIISGFEDNTVRPQECANRAQSAQLIYKLLMQ